MSLARLQSLGPSSVYTSIDAFGFTEDPPRLNSGEAVLALVDVHLKSGGAVILVVRTPPRPEGLPDVMRNSGTANAPTDERLSQSEHCDVIPIGQDTL